MTKELTLNIPGNGVLALVGSGEYLPPMDPVDRYLISLLNGDARVVCLPTAAGTEGDERIQYWMDLGENHFRDLNVSSVKSLRVIDRHTAMDESIAAEIHQANFVYLSGGKPPHLLDSLQGSPVMEAILAVLKSGGVVAGCSAGAMIWGGRVPGFRFPFQVIDGLGFLTGTVVVPHFDEMPSAIASVIPTVVGNNLLVGVDGNTALVCQGTTWKVVGRGGVTIGKTRFTAES